MSTFQKNRPGDDAPMLIVEDAQAAVLNAVSVLGVESVFLADAHGRTLRGDVDAPHDVPEGDNSAMDGYAVRASDTTAATRENPAVLRVTGDLAAGASGEVTVGPSNAIRIMTGALIPDGADAVAEVEITDAGTETVQIFRPVLRGTNIRQRGEDMLTGARVLVEGASIGAGEIGVLAAVQRSSVLVGIRPRVAILSTGDEVVELSQERGRGQVVNSNAWSMAALVREHGGVPEMRGVVRDDLAGTVEAIRQASHCDFIISTGGVSAGAYDFVKDALDQLGAETIFWRVAMKPGKPVVFARLGQSLYFGLPGNPVSCMISFALFVGPALRKASGRTGALLPATVTVTLDGPLRSKGDRRAYQRVRLFSRDGELVALPMRAQGSGVSTSMVSANALVVMPEGVTSLATGERASALLLGQIFTEA